MARSYEALTVFLRARSEPVVVASFTELDRVVGGLPASARKYQAWWANSRHSQPQRVAPLTPLGEAVQVSVGFEWLDVASIDSTNSGRPVFAGLPNGPGICRFTLNDATGEVRGVYIGETDNLARRMTHYRNPGPTQPTNQRLHHKIRDAIHHGGSAHLAVATNVQVNGETIDLSLRPARLLAENAALITAHQLQVPIENL